jgi:zinc/manganese transport system substrate-binding protein
MASALFLLSPRKSRVRVRWTWFSLLTVAVACMVPRSGWPQERLRIVAAENYYGDVAGQIAGPDVAVDSIMTNPDQDPHLFEATPSVARMLAAANIVVMNGADYDPWMAQLLRASPRPRRVVIDVGALMHVKPGANPHLWYDLAAMTAFARTLANDLSRIDPGHQTDYSQHLTAFLGSIDPVSNRVADMRKAFTGTPVTATEPVFGYMASALGLKMLSQRFQLAVMNDTEPSARDVAAFERDLRDHAVRVLIYNRQTTSGPTRRMLDLAERSGVPVVGVTETEPAGKTYQQWMLDQLDSLNTALSKPAS